MPKKKNTKVPVDPPSASQELDQTAHLTPNDVGFSSNHRPNVTTFRQPPMNNYYNPDWEDGAFGMNPPTVEQNNEAAWAFHYKKHDIGNKSNRPVPMYPDPPRTPPSIIARRSVHFADGTMTNSPIFFELDMGQQQKQSTTTAPSTAPSTMPPKKTTPPIASPSPPKMNQLSVNGRKSKQKGTKEVQKSEYLLFNYFILFGLTLLSSSHV